MNLFLVQLEQDLNRWRLEQVETQQRMEWYAGVSRRPRTRRLAAWLGDQLVIRGERLRGWAAAHTGSEIAPKATAS